MTGTYCATPETVEDPVWGMQLAAGTLPIQILRFEFSRWGYNNIRGPFVVSLVTGGSLTTSTITANGQDFSGGSSLSQLSYGAGPVVSGTSVASWTFSPDMAIHPISFPDSWNVVVPAGGSIFLSGALQSTDTLNFPMVANVWFKE